MTERPDLKLTWLDLDEDLTEAALSRLLGSIGSEQEVVYRDGALHAARLRPCELRAADTTASATPPAPRAYALRLGERGRLDTFSFVACERPQPGRGEVEIEVDLAGLAFRDVAKSLGLLSQRITQAYFGDEIGAECAGRISAVGIDVDDFHLGDRVYCAQGGVVRSHVIAPAARLLRLPDSSSRTQALNLLNFLTAHVALLRLARLRSGEKVLIHGAAGGVGLAAIEVARECGAEIFGTASTEEKRKFVEARGVARVGNSRDVAFADEIRAWTDGRGVDVVLNFSPGEIMQKSLACLAPFGRFVEIGKMAFDKDTAMHMRHFNENLSYFALDVGRVLADQPDEALDALRRCWQNLDSGVYRPTPTVIIPASQVGEAFRRLTRDHIGKICLALGDEELRPEPEVLPRFRADATYVITGGLRGFGREVALWMAKEGACRLALLGRSGDRSEEAIEALAMLRARGVDARAFAIDVSDRPLLERALAQIESTMPPLRGIIHAATVYEDQLISHLDRGALERTCAAKAAGAWNLHALTRDKPLDLFVLFSSFSSLVGNAGQASYVAANTFVEQLGRHRRRLGLPAITIQWGALAEAGVIARDERLARQLRHLGVKGLSTSDALAALGRILDAKVEQIAVVDADWERIRSGVEPWGGRRRLDGWMAEDVGSMPGAGGASVPVALETLDPDEVRSVLIDRLTRAAAKVMGVASAELDAAIPLREVGMDSLIAVEIAAEAEANLGFRIPPMLIAAGPSVHELAASLMERKQEMERASRVR